MKHIIKYKAQLIETNELVRDTVEIDNPVSIDAERQFEREFNFNRYKDLKITKVKGVK